MDSNLALAAAILVAILFAVLYLKGRTNERLIRKDAVARSRSVTVGKVTEQIAPWLPDFPFNPKDARFIGSPIDMIVFDGCDDGNVKRVVFLEIKTSTSNLSTRQRQIRDAIKAGHIEWQELRIP